MANTQDQAKDKENGQNTGVFGVVRSPTNEGTQQNGQNSTQENNTAMMSK